MSADIARHLARLEELARRDQAGETDRTIPFGRLLRDSERGRLLLATKLAELDAQQIPSPTPAASNPEAWGSRRWGVAAWAGQDSREAAAKDH